MARKQEVLPVMKSQCLNTARVFFAQTKSALSVETLGDGPPVSAASI